MSLTPQAPNFNLKSFWKRPEGKTGALVLLATAVVGAYGFAMILPWLIALLANTLYAVVLGVALIGVLYVVTNKTFRSILNNSFRLGMRWMTGLLVEIDPIGILKNNLDMMIEKARELDKGVEGCAGAKRQLENQITQNTRSIEHSRSLIQEAEKAMAREQDPLRKQAATFRRQSYLQEIGRRMQSNENMQRVLDQTNRMYTMLGRWQNLAEYNIENTRAEVKNAEEERKSILASYRALGPAQRLIRGDPEQLKMMNASLEFLAEDNANKLGAMEDFSRYSEKFLSDMDFETGASAADAEKMLAAYEGKLLSTGAKNDIASATDPEPIAINRREK